MTRGAWVILVFGATLVGTRARAQVPTECEGDEAVPYECFIDVTCPLAAPYEQVRRSVVHIYGPDSVGTGVLINNADCSGVAADSDCGKPYLLTSAHLFTDIWDPVLAPNDIYAIENETTFTLGFVDPFCTSGQSVYAIAFGGSQVISHSVDRDLLLVRLDTTIPSEASPYFSGWGTSEEFDEVALIAHPCGGPQKISTADFGQLGFMQTLFINYLIIWSWDEGAQTSGSSGGPLFSNTGALLGVFKKQDSDVCPGSVASAHVIGTSTIVSFLDSISNNNLEYPSYDPGMGDLVSDVVTNQDYYGPGKVVEITATQHVTLASGFHADAGSHVHVVVVPSPP